MERESSGMEFTGINKATFTRMRPVNNITPFTYSDGTTYLEILNAMERYIKRELVPSLDKEFTDFVADLNSVIYALENSMDIEREKIQGVYNTFTQLIRDQVEVINNKTGAIDIQQIRLTGTRTIAIDPTWPTNQPVEFVVTQDATGNRSITFSSDIRGTVTLDKTANAVTRFTLYPDGTGAWFAVQTPNTLGELDARITATVKPLQESVTKSLADGDAARVSFQKGITAEMENNGFLFANFVGNGVSGEHLNLFYSPDGKTLFGGDNNPAYTPADGNALRDPSLLYRNGRWYAAYTTKDGQNKDFAIASSATGHAGSWSLLTKVSVASASGLVKAWAPEFVVDGSDVYVFFSRITAANVGDMYYVKATNTALTAWSAPVAVNFVDEPANYIDGVPIKGEDGKWYLFYSTGASIDRAVSDTITGTWKTDKSGNWAGWGSGIEGPTILKDGDLYRIYFDRYESNQGIHWSESASLNGPWSGPVKVVTAPYVLKAGQTLRHGSVVKLSDAVARNKITAALSMAPASVDAGTHSEWQNPPGVPVPKDKATVMRWVVPDDAEMVNPNLVSFEDGGTFTLNEYCVYAISMTAGAKGVTGVTRSFIEMTNVAGDTVHMRQSGGAEDLFSFSLANFKPRSAGEKFRFRIYLNWTGTQPEAAVPVRVRITKIANL